MKARTAEQPSESPGRPDRGAPCKFAPRESASMRHAGRPAGFSFGGVCSVKIKRNIKEVYFWNLIHNYRKFNDFSTQD